MFEYIGDFYTDEVHAWVERRVDQGDTSFDEAWRAAVQQFEPRVPVAVGALAGVEAPNLGA
jgi:hypothetical protein